MENSYLLPADLCDRIFAHEFEMDTGNISEDLLTHTVQLYVEAISYYTTLNAQMVFQAAYDPTALARRSKFYQQKIKRLLVRSDVQQCLVGKSSNPKGMDLQKELTKINLQIPEQARALLKHYTCLLKQKQNLIESSLARQRHQLAERIERRSKSKRRSERKGDEVQMNLIKLKMGALAHF